MMKTMNISDSTYHIKMLTDLAIQNEGALVLIYDSGKMIDEHHADGSISVVGRSLRIMTLVTNIVVAVAEKNGLTVDEMLRMISDVVRMRKEKGYDEP